MRAPVLTTRRRSAERWFGIAAGTRRRALLLATALAGLGAGLGALQAWQQARAQTLALQQRLEAAQRAAQPRPLPAPPPRPALPAKERDKLNAMVRQLNTPWPALLAALEHHARDGVAVLQLEPDPRRGTVQLLLESTDADALLAHAERLGDDPRLGRLRLLRHETNEQDPNRPARLLLELRGGTVAAEEGPP